MELNEQDSKAIRIQKIISILKERNGSSVRELANELGVSEMTIRRDFEYLSATNAIKRVHGAVIYNPDFISAELSEESSTAPTRDIRAAQYGAAMAELIEPGDAILIDCGKLAFSLAQALPGGQDYDIFTYSTAVMERATACANQVYFIGGTYHPQSAMCESEQSAATLRQFRFNKMFLFPDGIHSEFGITCANHFEVASKKAAIASALKIILVADSSCFEAVSRNYFADIGSVNMVVTDNGLSGFWRTHLFNMGIEVVYVS